MSYTSRLKLTVDNFSPETDLIEVFSKKAGVVGVINPSQIASPSGISGAIQFTNGSAFASDASNLFWDNTNKRLGIGTNAPTTPLSIINGNGAYDGSAGISFGGNNFRLSNYFNIGIISAPNGPIYALTGAFCVGTSYGNAQSVNTAMLGVRGTGSTSATTSLLVQNSSGDQIFKIQDDGSSTFGRSGANSLASFYGLTGLQCVIGNDSIQTPSNIYRTTNGQLTFYGRNNNANAFSFEHNNSQQSNASGVSMINIGGGYNTQNDAQFSSLQIVPSYDLNANTTTNSIARGIYYNPTITNLRVAQHRAIETTTGDVLFGTTSGKAIFGSGVYGTSYIEIKPGSFNGNNRITFNDYDGNITTRGGFLELGTYAAKLQFGRYNQFGLGCDLYPYTLSAISSTGEQSVIISSGSTAPVSNGSRLQVYGTTFIKGSGSTSATTSLLVQNSSGNRLLEQKDNGWLYIGNTATDTGVIYVPHSPTYADRVFMRIDGGFPLFSTISNALLEISCAQFYTQGDMTLRNANTGIRGGTASNINNSSIQLSTQVNAYNGTSQNDACSLLYIENRGATLQASGSINWIKMDGNVYEAGGGGNKWCTGIYYNPTFTGGTLLANSHYCYHATSGQMMVNTTSPNASAQLQVDSTTRGFLPPRMTTAEKNAIATPAIGLMVFDTTLGRPCFYNGAWVTL